MRREGGREGDNEGNFTSGPLPSRGIVNSPLGPSHAWLIVSP